MADNHEGERAVDGADLAAADRRVEKRATALTGRSGQAPRRGWGNRGRVHDDRVRLHGREDAIGPFEHRGNVGTIRQHRDDDARLSRDVRRRGGGRSSGGDQRVYRAATAAVHDHVELVLAEVEGHGLAHEAKTDEANRG